MRTFVGCVSLLLIFAGSSLAQDYRVQGEVASIDWSKRVVTVRLPRGTEQACKVDAHTKFFIDGKEARPWQLTKGHVVQFAFGIRRADNKPDLEGPAYQVNAFVETDPPLIRGRPGLQGKAPPARTEEEVQQAKDATKDLEEEMRNAAEKPPAKKKGKK